MIHPEQIEQLAGHARRATQAIERLRKAGLPQEQNDELAAIHREAGYLLALAVVPVPPEYDDGNTEAT